jgi:hypothetical protein
VDTAAVNMPELAINGGSIQAPRKPPLDYDKSKLLKLHKAALDAEDRLLHAVIVLAERSGEGQPWRARAKLVTRTEYEQLRNARAPVETEIKGALSAISKDAKRVSFGRDTRDGNLRLVREDDSGRADLTPPPWLAQLFARTEEIYRKAGLEPVIAHWTLRGNDLDFREYFE